MDIIKAIQKRWPGACLVVRGDVVERWDGPMARPTDAEIAQAIADYTPALARLDRFTLTSRQKDELADAAARVRSRGITAWGNMTLAQKRDATLAEADAWVTIRQFIEDNL
jgi:hypothetical protein